MIIFLVICIIFLIMFLSPIFIGLVASKQENTPLFIQQSNTRNPKYFVMAFKDKFESTWESYDGSGMLTLSKEEQIIEVDKTELSPKEICNAVVYAENNSFSPKEGIVFTKEIYAKKNAYLKNIPTIRAIACMGDLVIGSGTCIIRWADAEGTLTINDDCDLGLCTTSSTKLLIGENCTFNRLYAPEIWLGKNNEEFDTGKSGTIPKEIVICSEIIHDIKYVDESIANEDGILSNTIITKHNIVVLENFIVHGHISSHKDVRIKSNAIVHGNIFAENDIFIESNAMVLGVIFTQGNIYVEDDVVLGQPNKIKSVVARGNIEFGRNCVVYGNISAEKTGKIYSNT